VRLQEESNFEERVKEVHAFNAANAWRKRGIAITPVRCGPPHPAASRPACICCSTSLFPCAAGGAAERFAVDQLPQHLRMEQQQQHRRLG
jgi:hypothetical protein